MVAAKRTAQHALGTARLAAQGSKCLIFGAGMLGVYGCALFHDLGMQVYITDLSTARDGNLLVVVIVKSCVNKQAGS